MRPRICTAFRSWRGSRSAESALDTANLVRWQNPWRFAAKGSRLARIEARTPHAEIRVPRPTGGRNLRYKSVTVIRRGGPEVLQVVERALRLPSPGEARVRVLATLVSGPDVQARRGQTPFAPKVPFVPGYAIVGTVDAVGGADRRSASGGGAATIAVGDRVAALTVRGGYSEYIYLAEEDLIPVPDGLDPAQAVTLILNYLVAYQVMHRSAGVEPGDKVLIIGASGGIGTALLQLGKLAGVEMYGIASARKHQVVTKYGATPIDYHTQDFVDVIRRAEPDGLDAAFDGVVWGYLDRGFSLLRRGGTWVQYGNPLSHSGLARLLGRLILLNLLPDGRSLRLYGTGASKRGGRWRQQVADWGTLFELLEEREIEPIIGARRPILEAAEANALLESGQVVGNVVLLSPELL
jgi:NADPH:quinone reductase-like Zn-dependent oxidoreductase